MDNSRIYSVYCVLLVVLLCGEVWCRRSRRKPSCGGEWVEMHRACYRFVTELKSWEEAKEVCREESGSLVSISSNAEKRVITRELQKQVTNDKLLAWWVGLRRNTSNRFLWDDGGAFQRRITRWGPGEPNNMNGREHCVEMKFDGKLNDKDCAAPKPFICEKHEITVRTTLATTPVTTTTSTTAATTAATTVLTSTPSTVPTTVATSKQPSSTDHVHSSERIDTKTLLFNTTTSSTTAALETSTKVADTTRMDTTTAATYTGTTLSILTSTTWEEKMTPFHGCFKLSDSKAPVNSQDDGTESASLLQYVPGATTCPPAYASNLAWPTSRAGEFAEVSCKNGAGKATWRCGANPTCWRGEPNVASCASPKFKQILKKVFIASAANATEAEKVEVTSALVKVTATENLSVEDVMLTSKIIQSLATQVDDDKPKDEKAVKSIVKNVVKAGSNIVSEDKSATWSEMAPKDKVRSASNLMTAMESTTVSMVAIIDHPTVIETKDENIDLEMHVIDVASSPEKELVYDDAGSENTISVPMDVLRSVSKGGLAKAVFMTHYKMADLLEDKTQTDDKPAPKIASSILSASLGTEEVVNLPVPITFTMKHVNDIPDSKTPLCSFWDTKHDNGYGRWSQEGCGVMDTNRTHTTCQCNHLTNFAILMDVEGVKINVIHLSLLRFITLVGCVISILCLFASWITFMCLSSLQGERNSIHKNLVACLFVAEVLFVAGIDRTDHKLACTLIAGFLHYFFLCVFMWMFIEGIHMVIMLVQVFDSARSRLPYYYMAAYGIPVVIISVSAGFFYQGYGTENYCWLTTDRYFIWSFAGPVALILLVNAVVLTYAMVMVCRHSEYVLNSKDKNSGGMKAWVQGALSMEVLLGLTWTLGYFFISKETVALAYIFTVLNSLQGLFIFCFHCLLNKKVMKEYKRILHISKRRPGASTQTASLMRKQSQSQSQSHTYEMAGKAKDSHC